MTTSRLRLTLLQFFADQPPKTLASWPVDNVHEANRITSKLLVGGYCAIPAGQLGFNISPETVAKPAPQPKKGSGKWTH